MAIRNRYKWILLSGLMIMCLSSFGQDSIDSNNKTSFSIHLIEGYRFDELGGFDASEFSKLGFEGQVSFHFSDKVGLQLKSGWMRWSKNRETYIPILLGPEFSFLITGNLQIVVYGNIGPALTIGNDFAGVFAAAESGLQFSSRMRRGIIVGFAWGLNAALHPSEFSILKGTIGWRF